MKVRGNDLTVFFELNGRWRALAYATVCELDINVEMIAVGDPHNGRWKKYRKGRASWKCSSAHLLAMNGFAIDFLDRITSDIPVKLHIGTIDRHIMPVEAESLQPNNRLGYEGEALIDRLTITARRGDSATFSINMTGNGALQNVSVDNWLLKGNSWNNSGVWYDYGIFNLKD